MILHVLLHTQEPSTRT